MWTVIYRGKLQYDRNQERKRRRKPADEEGEGQEDGAKGGGEKQEKYVPDWVEEYIKYKFYLYDRAGEQT